MLSKTFLTSEMKTSVMGISVNRPWNNRALGPALLKGTTHDGSRAFWERKRENLKTVCLTCFKLQSILSWSISDQRHSTNLSDSFRFLFLKERFRVYDRTPNFQDTFSLVSLQEHVYVLAYDIPDITTFLCLF